MILTAGFNRKTKLLKEMEYYLVVGCHRGRESSQVFTPGNIHCSLHQLPTQSDPLVWITNQDAQTSLIRSMQLAQSDDSQNAALFTGVLAFSDEGDLAIIVTMTDTGEAIMDHTLLKHHGLQIAHKDGSVRKESMEFCEQGFIFGQYGPNDNFGVIFCSPGTHILN